MLLLVVFGSIEQIAVILKGRRANGGSSRLPINQFTSEASEIFSRKEDSAECDVVRTDSLHLGVQYIDLNSVPRPLNCIPKLDRMRASVCTCVAQHEHMFTYSFRTCSTSESMHSINDEVYQGMTATSE